MARHFGKRWRLLAALGMSLIGVGASLAAESIPEGSISADTNPGSSSLEITTRSFRARPLVATQARPAATASSNQPNLLPARSGAEAGANSPLQLSQGSNATSRASFAEPSNNEEPATEAVTITDDGSTLAGYFKPLPENAVKLDGSGGGGCGPCGSGSGSNCGCCCVCGPPGRFWIRDEYLGFWGKSDHLPALVNTGVIPGAPSTITLFGDQNVNGGYRSGNWIQAGAWLDSCKSIGIQGDYLALGRASTGFYDSSSGNPVLTRPFTNAITGAPGAELISYPGLLSGNVSVSDYNSFNAAGLAGVRELICSQCCSPCDNPCFQNCFRLDGIAGFRYYQYNDNLNITENLTTTSAGSGVPTGTNLRISDTFRTVNNFYGLELGLRAQRWHNRWLFEGSSLVALGDNSRLVYINGTTNVTYPGLPTVHNSGGLLALGSNMGTYRSQNFMAIPQFSGRVGYRVTQRLTLLAGYTFIFWGGVANAANQIDTTVNPNLLPPATAGGPARPAYHLAESNFWVQGFTLGGQFNF